MARITQYLFLAMNLSTRKDGGEFSELSVGLTDIFYSDWRKCISSYSKPFTGIAKGTLHYACRTITKMYTGYTTSLVSLKRCMN